MTSLHNVRASSITGRVLLVVASTLLLSCTDSAGFESATYTCSEDRPCAAGWRCQVPADQTGEGVCVRESTPQPDVTPDPTTDVTLDVEEPDLRADSRDTGTADLAEDSQSPELSDTPVDSSDTEDVSLPPPGYGETCDPSLPNDCVDGLACLPSGVCRELCDESYCATPENMCFGTSPDYVCDGPDRTFCVDGPGGFRLCNDIELAFSENFCPDDNNGFPWWYHQYTAFPDQPCYDDALYIEGLQVCYGGLINSSLEELGGDLWISTERLQCGGTPCTVLETIELNGLEVIGGELSVGYNHYGGCEGGVVPLRALEAPVLRKVFGRVLFSDAIDITHINYPQLTFAGGYFVVKNMPAIETIYLPKLETIGGALMLQNLPALKNLELGSLRRIEGAVSIRNAPCLDPAVLDAIRAIATGPVDTYGSGAGCAN